VLAGTRGVNEDTGTLNDQVNVHLTPWQLGGVAAGHHLDLRTAKGRCSKAQATITTCLSGREEDVRWLLPSGPFAGMGMMIVQGASTMTNPTVNCQCPPLAASGDTACFLMLLFAAGRRTSPAPPGSASAGHGFWKMLVSLHYCPEHPSPKLYKAPGSHTWVCML
jgi:hypothetical protein